MTPDQLQSLIDIFARIAAALEGTATALTRIAACAEQQDAPPPQA